VAGHLHRLLLLIVLVVVGIDCAWLAIQRIDVDVSSYITIAAASAGLALVGLFYEYIRKDPNLSNMLLGTSFLIAFAAAFAVLNYLLLTVAGTRIDTQLAAVDRAMGADWPAMMAFAAAHPRFNYFLFLAYRSVLPQITLVIVCLGCRGRSDDIIAFCLALAAGAGVTVVTWTLFPSFGAFSVYDLPAVVESRLTLALDSHYAHALVTLLSDGPRRIAPNELKGLIGFPSFHIVLAVLNTWYARSWKWIFLPLGLLNLVVFVATPIQGGHHVIDVIAGIAVAALSIAFVARLVRQDAPNMAAPAIVRAQPSSQEPRAA
jgi:hypothetical protein